MKTILFSSIAFQIAKIILLLEAAFLLFIKAPQVEIDCASLARQSSPHLIACLLQLARFLFTIVLRRGLSKKPIAWSRRNS